MEKQVYDFWQSHRDILILDTVESSFMWLTSRWAIDTTYIRLYFIFICLYYNLTLIIMMVLIMNCQKFRTQNDWKSLVGSFKRFFLGNLNFLCFIFLSIFAFPIKVIYFSLKRNVQLLGTQSFLHNEQQEIPCYF